MTKTPKVAPERGALPCAIYCRISRDKEGGGLGVERQEADCRALAERLGWKVVAVFVDNDLSAYSGKKRPQYEQMLRAVETGAVHGIIAWHTDRLHRRTVELESFVSLAESHGLQVETVTSGQLNLSTASGRMVARMLGAAAQHEIDHARERMKAAKAQMAAAGKYRGGPRPYGYETGGLVVRESEAQVIRDATAAVLAGRTLASIARELQEAGATTSTGAEWTYNRLRDVLTRPRNAGLVANGRTDRGVLDIIGPAEWPAIVDEDSFRAVWALLSDPSRRRQNGNDTRWLGSGIYTCGICQDGSTLRPAPYGGTAKSKRERQYLYRCTEKAHLSISTDKTDGFVREIVVELLRDERVVAALMPDTTEAATADRERRSVLLARIEQTEADYDTDLIDARRFKAKTDRLTDELAVVQGRLDASLAGMATSPVLNAPDPGQAFLDAPIDVQRAVLAAVLRVEILPTPRRGMQWTNERVHVEPAVDPEQSTGA